MIAQIVWDINPIIFTIDSFEFGYYGLCWVLAFGASYWVLSQIFKREGISPQLLASLFVYVFIGTFLGARLGHCFFYEADYFLKNPLEILLPIAKIKGEWHFVGFSGLASHGAAIGIVISLLIFSWRKKFNLWDVSDKLGLVAPLGGFFIRLGNLFNSEIIGMQTDMPWGFVFTRVDQLPRHPSQLYEAIAYLLIFVVVLYLYNRKRDSVGRGFVLGMSVTLIFVARFLIEYSKEVQESFEVALRAAVGMDMGQLLSLPFIIAGVLIMVIKRKPK